MHFVWNFQRFKFLYCSKHCRWQISVTEIACLNAHSMHYPHIDGKISWYWTCWGEKMAYWYALRCFFYALLNCTFSTLAFIIFRKGQQMDIMKLVSSHAALCLFLRAIADTEKLFSEYVIYHLLCCGNSKFLDKFNEKINYRLMAWIECCFYSLGDYSCMCYVM